ncbi:phospholipase D family nuclease [Pectinatus frisingensis]|uniref:phospholipase D family nuclease n=1 Tax=Pectinatus frisingensis TaxID=865 RepID=UPI0018C82154|nr:phospholipase D family protein [Pectinatus frisingensis]
MKKLISVMVVITVFLAGFMLGCSSKDTTTGNATVDKTAEAQATLPDAISHSNIVNATGTIEVAFSPNGAATDTVIKAINEAKESIKVQAYSFTSAPIAKALLNAQKRGIDVKIILDKSQETAKYSSATFFANNNVPVKIDHDFAIAHSKVMIIDDVNVITGSFNFTKAAQEKNAENVLVIRGNKELAKYYLENWQWRWDNTQDYSNKK